MRNSHAWTTSKRRQFSDILVMALSPTRRGPGSYQYRVKLKRRGPAVKHPPGSFFGAASLIALPNRDSARILALDVALRSPRTDSPGTSGRSASDCKSRLPYSHSAPTPPCIADANYHRG